MEFIKKILYGFKYRGLSGSANFEDGVYTGQIAGIKDLVTYESKTEEGLKEEFKISVDDYFKLRSELAQ